MNPIRPRNEAELNATGGLAVDQSTLDTNGRAEASLARDMIEVHGAEAATVARDNARAAALAAQIPEAKSWIRVLGIIQRIGPIRGY